MGAPAQAALVEERTLLVTRESKEYSNVFHMLTDLFNTHLALRMLGWLDDGSPRRVVLLDNHPVGPLDGMWAGVAAGGGLKALQGPWNATGRAGVCTRGGGCMRVPSCQAGAGVLVCKLPAEGLLGWLQMGADDRIIAWVAV